MLRIETCGTWYEMGHACGCAFRDELLACMDTYTPDLRNDPGHSRVVEPVAAMLSVRAPDILEETEGFADALELPLSIMLYYRLFPCARFLNEGCSAFFVADAPEGPLLVQTTDLNPRDTPVQVLWIRRPVRGTATLTTSYLGLIGGRGMNEHGLGRQGTSAHTTECYGSTGVVSMVLAHRLLQDCGAVAEATALITKEPVLGKGAVWLVADATGDSALFDLAHGRLAPAVPRPLDVNWQACSNFYVSGAIPFADEPAYLYNAYARYGRLLHQLAGNPATQSLQGARQLAADVSQPGPHVPEGASKFETIYAAVMNLRARVVHLCPGNPNRDAFEEISL